MINRDATSDQRLRFRGSIPKEKTPIVRIALVIPTLDRSGAEKQLTLLATRLPREEFTPHVFALTRGGPYAADFAAASVPVTVIGKRWKLDLGAWRRLRTALHEFQPDIVHSWLFAANAYTRLSLPRRPRPRVIVSERCVDLWKSGWQLWLDRKLAPVTDRVVGNSQSVVEFYREQGLSAEKLCCIPNGVELPTDLSCDRNALLQGLGFPTEAFVLGCVGRLAAQKRVRDIIFATETLRQIRPQLRLVIIGDGPERTRLEEFARSVGCHEHVRFLGHREDAAAWLPLFDAFCLASSFEGQSNSLMEAMAAGRAVVVSDIPPNRELVTPESTGLIFKPGDAVGIMQQLRRLIDEPDLRTRLGIAAREQMESKFRIETMVERYVDLYREVAGASTTR
jgi:glycosyltransferase involved in cell wall biosynthesis